MSSNGLAHKIGAPGLSLTSSLIPETSQLQQQQQQQQQQQRMF